MLFGVPYLISSFISLKSDVLVHWFLLIGHEADSKTIPVRHSIYSHPYSTARHPLVTKFERHPVSSDDPPPYWHILSLPVAFTEKRSNTQPYEKLIFLARLPRLLRHKESSAED
jgi:hypothetical protein